MMALGTIERPPSGEALDACGYESSKGRVVTLAERKHNGRSHVRLYFDKAGRPFVRDRYKRVRYIRAIRFLTIDGQPLECGSAVLEKESD